MLSLRTRCTYRAVDRRPRHAGEWPSARSRRAARPFARSAVSQPTAFPRATPTRLRCSQIAQTLIGCRLSSVQRLATISRSPRCLPSIRLLKGVGLGSATIRFSCPPCFDEPSLICENHGPFVRAESVVRVPSLGLRGTLEKHSTSASPLKAPAARRCSESSAVTEVRCRENH
jgi:hypothetical protein